VHWLAVELDQLGLEVAADVRMICSMQSTGRAANIRYLVTNTNGRAG
jgi:hypothetical protein